jgi:hypothetical protein
MNGDARKAMNDDEQRAMLALRHLARHTTVPQVDRTREAQLLAAFDAIPRPRRPRSWWWWTTGLASATTALIVMSALPLGHDRPDVPPPGRLSHGPQAGTADVPPQRDATGEFVAWPGTAGLPPLESGQLVRVELPVSVLATLGLRPPASRRTAVRADLLVGQDGLTRAVRLVD